MVVLGCAFRKRGGTVTCNGRKMAGHFRTAEVGLSGFIVLSFRFVGGVWVLGVAFFGDYG
jgi:hypothetical protein